MQVKELNTEIPVKNRGKISIRAPLPFVLVVGTILTLTPLRHELWAQQVVSPQEPTKSSTTIPEMDRAVWQKSMSKRTLPGKGCFVANYPSTTWAPAQCVLAQPYPLNVGGGADFVAQAQSGKIISATGSFPSITSLSGLTENDATNSFWSFTFGGTNDFSLQVNANEFQTSTSNGTLQNGTNPCASGGCIGWQQFLLANFASVSPIGSNLYIQFWLLGYQADFGNCPNSQIPGGWESGIAGQWRTSKGGCFINSPAVSVPIQNISDLSGMVLTGTVNLGGLDVASLLTHNQGFALALPTDFIGLNNSWTQAEFNVFGLWNSSQAVFSPGTTITVANTLTGQGGAPISAACQNGSGTTAETNNLNLGLCPCFSNGSEIEFTESNVTNNGAFCACPNGLRWNYETNSCACVPNCAGSKGIMCGGQPDGCGGTCNSCGNGMPCEETTKTCCAPKCAGARCGAPDGCGGSCPGYCKPSSGLTCRRFSAGGYACDEPGGNNH